MKIIQPETVKQWNRLGWRVLASAKYRKNLGGRPPIEKEIRDIIKRMAFENFLWGAPRIHGEMLKLGYQVGEATVSRYIARFFPGRRHLTWSVFFRNQLVGFENLSLGAKSMAKIGSLSGLLTQIPRNPTDQPVGAKTIMAAGTAAYANRRADIRDGLLISNLSVIRIRGSPLMIAYRETPPTIYLPPTSICVGWGCVANNSFVCGFLDLPSVTRPLF
ncbi:MAG: hypothetical protein HQL84_17395 [Magnetococcales bacterium]|nr:hypothetical protein [Magnetococcales bacterium]